jgi:hypothetical protein
LQESNPDGPGCSTCNLRFRRQVRDDAKNPEKPMFFRIITDM